MTSVVTFMKYVCAGVDCLGMQGQAVADLQLAEAWVLCASPQIHTQKHLYV